jgi:hypothetical protein
MFEVIDMFNLTAQYMHILKHRVYPINMYNFCISVKNNSRYRKVNNKIHS